MPSLPNHQAHVNGADVQRRHREGDAHARKGSRQFPDADQAHEADDPDEGRQRGEQRNGNRDDEDDGRRDRLREVAPRLPRRPTRRLVHASGPRGKDAGEKRLIR